MLYNLHNILLYKPSDATLILGSSTVEHAAVNRRVVGSNPTRGA